MRRDLLVGNHSDALDDALLLFSQAVHELLQSFRALYFEVEPEGHPQPAAGAVHHGVPSGVSSCDAWLKRPYDCGFVNQLARRARAGIDQVKPRPKELIGRFIVSGGIVAHANG
jgi:hypothetical protein